MKKSISVLLLLSLLAAVLCVPFSASALTLAQLSDSVSYDTGRTTITWEILGDEAGPYNVIVQAEGGSVTQARFQSGETSEHTFQAIDMIPGRTYTVYLTDKNMSYLGQKSYTLPDPVTFEDGKLKAKSAKISMNPVKMRHNGDRTRETKKVKALKADEIVKGLEDGSTDYGLKYSMKMPQLVKSRSFFVTVAMESPDGFLHTIVAKDITFDRINNGYQTTYFYMIGDNFFSTLYKVTGAVPAGTYKIHLFWDGMWVNTSEFKVK